MVWIHIALYLTGTAFCALITYKLVNKWLAMALLVFLGGGNVLLALEHPMGRPLTLIALPLLAVALFYVMKAKGKKTPKNEHKQEM